MTPLDNPIWHALNSQHLDRSLGGPLAKRYRPEIAPFMSIPSVSEQSEDALLNLVQSGERVCILNVAPDLTKSWRIEKEIVIIQMIWDRPSVEPDSREDIVRLSNQDIPAMLELTSLVYPAYFRAGTAALGDYLGIYDGDRLCAMAGIRMAMPGYQEISAVCTHPDYRGRGLAKALMFQLIYEIHARGNQTFLHTEDYNVAARGMYSSMGFATRAELPFWIVTRMT